MTMTEPPGYHVEPRPPTSGRVRCDGFGCPESHPIDHPDAGEPGFTRGRWVGWVYLDINDARLLMRPLRFCSYWCLKAWIGDIEVAQRERYRTGRGDGLSLDDMHNDLAERQPVMAARDDGPRPPLRPMRPRPA